MATVVAIHADHVTLRGLHFVGTPDGVHGVTLYGASGVTIEDCLFEDIGGLAIVETMTAHAITVRRNVILRSRATAMYLGCHDGSCAVRGVRVEGNYIDGVTAPAPWVGYGVQVKLGSQAIVQDNVIIGTKGPPIMVYGARDPSVVSVVEHNFVSGSRRSSGIVVGGGPAVVRGNVSAGNARAGIALQDYGRRGLLRDVEVTGNTVYGNRRGGVMWARGRSGRALVTGNRAYAFAGARSWRAWWRGG